MTDSFYYYYYYFIIMVQLEFATATWNKTNTHAHVDVVNNKGVTTSFTANEWELICGRAAILQQNLPPMVAETDTEGPPGPVHAEVLGVGHKNRTLQLILSQCRKKFYLFARLYKEGAKGLFPTENGFQIGLTEALPLKDPLNDSGVAVEAVEGAEEEEEEKKLLKALEAADDSVKKKVNDLLNQHSD